MSGAEIRDLKPILIKVSCDGTSLSRNVKVVNVVFNLINEKLKAATASGCYRIGIFKIDTEDYESTKEWLPTIWNQIKTFTHMHYDKIDRKVLCTKVSTLAQFAKTVVLSTEELDFITICIDFNRISPPSQ